MKKLFDDESNALVEKYMKEYGHHPNRFIIISNLMPKYSPKQLSNRWRNFLDPKLCHLPLEENEKEFITKWIHKNQTGIDDIIHWKEIRLELKKHFHKVRSENDLKKFWYAKLRKDKYILKDPHLQLPKPLHDDATYKQRNFPTTLSPLEPYFVPKFNDLYKMKP
ncbi:hypothetical protein C1645_835496 [Glomus cerebriforme]|uniref:HTH myb-type domain-containing protein n=1 Tax=Glomus cerebriforme TaxID=658196 RepID=A0A397SCA5_9GLOM|nr:hypothetical protein C1645_835496 [Glomus cerebriforme]